MKYSAKLSSNNHCFVFRKIELLNNMVMVLSACCSRCILIKRIIDDTYTIRVCTESICRIPALVRTQWSSYIARMSYLSLVGWNTLYRLGLLLQIVHEHVYTEISTLCQVEVAVLQMTLLSLRRLSVEGRSLVLGFPNRQILFAVKTTILL